MKADRGHLHHRLVDKGYSHKRAVIFLYVIASGLGIAGILLSMNDLLLAGVIIGLILVFWIVDMTLTSKRKKALEKKLADRLNATAGNAAGNSPSDSVGNPMGNPSNDSREADIIDFKELVKDKVFKK
jgi:Flp pilus assembly protein TadB